MYQAKVSNTQQYSDSQGEHIVCKGKLVLLETKENDDSIYVTSDISHNWDYLKPVIISETEEIIGTKVLWMPSDDIRELHDVQDYRNNRYEVEDPVRHTISEKNTYKVLALPEHFSDKHLQAIVDGKMKDGDEVLVKCFKESDGYYVYLQHNNQQNHITLFPAKQSLEKAFKEWFYNDIPKTSEFQIFKAGAEWAKKNNF